MSSGREVLSQRALNRATLARQHLLERTPLPPLDAIEHLAGMQSQAPLAPYVGLWTRLRDFAASELSALTEDRQVVRLHLMRNTVHLVSARDALGWRTLFAPLHAAEFAARFGRAAGAVDQAALVAEARRLLEDRPRTRGELGALLARRWPETHPSVLAFAATHLIAMCQVPPRGVWGRSGPAAWTLADTWLGAPLRAVPVDELVLRYLGAFGPATVADIQLWSGLTRLREVAQRLPLRTFQAEGGQVLYDLPGAPRPPADIPAPPRFLPEYDNLLLSHQDRARLIAGRRTVPLPPGTGATGGTFLVDGMWQGTWRFRDQALRVQPFVALPAADREALLTEAAALSEFLAPGASYEIILEHQPRAGRDSAASRSPGAAARLPRP